MNFFIVNRKFLGDLEKILKDVLNHFDRESIGSAVFESALQCLNLHLIYGRMNDVHNIKKYIWCHSLWQEIETIIDITVEENNDEIGCSFVKVQRNQMLEKFSFLQKAHCKAICKFYHSTKDFSCVLQMLSHIPYEKVNIWKCYPSMEECHGA